MPNLGKVFRLEVVPNQLLCLVASGLDLLTFDLVSFRVG